MRRGVALSQRLGIRTFLPYHVGNGYSGAIRTGDWAWFEAMARDVLAIMPGLAADWSRRRLAAIAVWRGVPPGSEFEDEMNEALAEKDPQTMLAQTAYVAAEFERAVRIVEDGLVDRFSFPYATAFGGRAALLAGDLDGAQRSLAIVETIGSYGALGVDAAMLRAGIQAVGGRQAEALAGYRSVLARYRELGLRFDVALTTTEMVALLGPTDPDVRARADEALAVLTELGAQPMVDRLTALLEGAASSTGPASAGRL